MAKFVKGQSGNPGGRKKGSREAASKYAKEALETLVDCLKSRSDRTRVMAAEAILDRAWGKAAPEGRADDVQSQARMRTLQEKKLEAEVRVLEKRANEGAPPPDGDLIPGTAEYDEMLEREWGYKRTGRKGESDGQGEATASADAPPNRRSLA